MVDSASNLTLVREILFRNLDQNYDEFFIEIGFY